MPESYISRCVPATEQSCSGSVRFPQMKSQAEASTLLIRNYLCCWHQLRFISILLYFCCNCSPTPTCAAVTASGAAYAGTNGAGNAQGEERRGGEVLGLDPSHNERSSASKHRPLCPPSMLCWEVGSSVTSQLH